MINKGNKRVFFGIPAGGQIKSILPQIKSTVRFKSLIIKWISLENIHLTLSFLGDISNNDLTSLIQSVENNISFAQFQLSISGTGVFPSEKSPKVLWMSLDEGIDELKILNH